MQLHKWTFIFTSIIGIILVIFPEIDNIISSYFYSSENGFIHADTLFVQLVFRSVPIISMILIIVLVLGILYKFLMHKNKKNVLKSSMIFLLLSLALGPGLSVNLLLKENFGRARPIQTTLFGGNKEFTAAGYYSDQCDTNCSFSSGHASIGFYFTSLSYIVPTQYKNLVFIGGAILGFVVGAGRVAQGGHFFSDIIFSFLVIMLANEISFRIWKKLCKKLLLQNS